MKAVGMPRAAFIPPPRSLPPRTPGGRYPRSGLWRIPVFVRSSVTFLIWGLIATLPGAVLPEMAASMNASTAAVGLSFIPWSAGFLVGALVAGRLASPASRRRAMSGASAVGIAGCAVVWAAYRPTILCFGLLLLGIGCGLIFIGTHSLVASAVKGQRGRALSLLDLSFSFGVLVCPLLVQALVRLGGGWRTAYAFLSASQAVIWLAATLDPGDRCSTALVETVSRVSEQRQSLFSSQCLGLACWTFFLGTIEWSQNTWLVDLGAHRPYGADGGRLTLFAFALGMMFGRLLILLMSIQIRKIRALVPLALAPALGLIMFLETDRLDASCLAEVIVGGSVGAILPSLLGRMMDATPALSAMWSMVAMVMLTVGGQVATAAISVGIRIVGYWPTFRLFGLFGLALTVALVASRHHRGECVFAQTTEKQSADN